MSLLDIQNLCVDYVNGSQVMRAVNDVSLSVEAGECVAVVGESGSGKTTLIRAILGLQPITSGTIAIQGAQVRGVSPRQAARVGVVWQDPYASLDPRWTVRRSMLEPSSVTGTPIDVDTLITSVGLSAEMADRYPHQLSGGQRQRVAIGRAISLKPPLVLCDEPTAALDLSVQAQILNLLKDQQQELGCAYLYISHDLVTVRYLAQRVFVMKAGVVVESGDVQDVFERPQHPYTQELLTSAPRLELA